MTLFQLTNALCAPLGVSGAETPLREKIAALMTPFCDTLYTDALGNLICEKKAKGEKETLLLCAHMDEIGFIVTDIDDRGFVRLAPIGYQYPENCAYAPLRFENGARGVLVPPHGTKLADLDVAKFVCDLGAKSRAQAARRVQIGETCATVSPLHRLFGGRICGRALDNKAGCAVLLHAAQRLADAEDLPYHLVYLFSAQEEVGCRGAAAAAFAVEPDYCINIDVTDTADEPEDKGHIKLGGGVCIKYKDQLVLPSRRMIAHLDACAKAQNLKTQEEIIERGGTDTGAVQSSRAGVVAGAISIPQRYAHTDAECVDLSDMEAAAALLTAAAKTRIKA